MKTMKLKEALEFALTQSHPVKKDVNMSKYALADILGIKSPIMIDKWLKGESKTIRQEAAERFKSYFNVEIHDHNIGGQMTMKIENDVLTV